MRNLIVEIEDTGIPAGVVQLVERLPDPFALQDETTITLKFAALKFVYNTGLALLATWRTALPAHVKVEVDDSGCTVSTKRLLIKTGFLEIIEKGVAAKSSYNYEGKVPIQPIVYGSTTEETIRSITGILDMFVGPLHNTESFRVMLSELCENTFVHAQFETPGFICANYHKTPNRLEIAIADSGIGIRASYLEGTNEEAKANITAGVSPLELAIAEGGSSKRYSYPGHFGYGLFLVRRLIEENFGRLTIISGSECINIERYHKQHQMLKNGWNGTFVGLLIDLERPLPLEQIYEETGLGAPTSQRPDSESHEEIAPPTPHQTASFIPADLPEIELTQYGTQLLTRETGIAIRADIATVLARGGTVKVVLDGVEDITPSVADECFGKLAESLGRENFMRRIILAGGSPLMSRLIELVVNNRVPL